MIGARRRSRPAADPLAGPDDPPRLAASTQGDLLTLSASGRWELQSADALHDTVAAVTVPDQVRRAQIDLRHVAYLDTAGAFAVRFILGELEAKGLTAKTSCASEAAETLLDQVCRAQMRPPPPEPPAENLIAVVERLGEGTIAFCREAKQMTGFFGMILVRLVGAFLRPRRIRGHAVLHHMEATGLDAIPIVGLLSFLIGVVLAYMGAAQLQRFGAELLVVNLLGLGILREMGVVMTSIIVAGRSSSAFTAQIGTMKVNQEVDAMQTIGLDPIELLVLPRIIALIITLPLLTFYAGIMGLLGGAIMSMIVLGISLSAFLGQLQEAVGLSHLWVGLIKAPVFAFTIAMVGCYEGLKVSGSAESVGRMTTQSVVASIFLVIILDAVFAIAFQVLGI